MSSARDEIRRMEPLITRVENVADAIVRLLDGGPRTTLTDIVGELASVIIDTTRALATMHELALMASELDAAEALALLRNRIAALEARSGEPIPGEHAPDPTDVVH